MSMPGLALAALLAAFTAVPGSAATAFSPSVLQCDGTYASGSNTRHPAPVVRVDISDGDGLKIGRARLGIVTSITRALWRFDAGVTASESCTADASCPGGRCRRVTYDYTEPNGSQNLRVGLCTYDSSNCTDNLGLRAALSRVPVGLGACPAAPASGSQSVFPASTLDSTRFSKMGSFSSALGQVSTSTVQTVDWDLPATYTLTAWIKTGTAASQRVLSAQSARGYWGFGVTAAGALRHFDSRDAVPDTFLGSGLTDNAWHLIHLVRNNTTLQRRFFIDGRFVGSVTATSTNSFTSHPLYSSAAIGGYYLGGENFNGNIDEVRVLVGALSDDDIKLEYNATSHSYSSDSGVSYSTRAGTYVPSTPANGDPGPVTYAPGEAWTAASRWIFLAQNINSGTGISATFAVDRDDSVPSPPTSFSGSPTTTNDITWSWGAPVSFCGPPASAVTYTLVDPATGLALNPPGPIAHPTLSVGENFAGGPNQLKSRAIKAQDTWGTSALAVAATVYTLAAAPASLSFSNVSSGSFTASWSANGNPAYTRFEFSYSTTNFAGGVVSTPAALGADYTSSSIGVGSLLPGTTYWVRVRAYSGRSSDFFGGVPTAFATAIVTTKPGAPALSATALSNSSVRFDWTSVRGATGYTLYGPGGSPVLYTGSALTYTSTTLSVNASYGAEVEANTPSGSGPRSTAFIFTLANTPASPSAPFVEATSITWAWSESGNPSYTFYELNYSTDSAFSVVLGTIPTSSTMAAASGLLPGTTYYARVRAISGSQAATSYRLFAATVTRVSGRISQNPTGGTPYGRPDGLAGQWHFDGTAEAAGEDLSGNGNDALFTCVSGGCSSTPTLAGGPPGLGSAASLSGLAHGLVRVPDAAAFDFPGSLTIVAWAYPTTTAQPNGAGIAVRGNGGSEDWALEVSGGRFRFMPHPAAVLQASATLSANAWTHLIGSYDLAKGTATLYVNGRPSATNLAVPARNNLAHDISIGNRQSAAASYDRGFIGRVDGVRLFNRAFSPAEALAEYLSNSASTITANAPNQRVQVGFAPDAFGAPATIMVSANPAASPIRVSAAALDAGLSSPPSSLSLVPNSLVEIVPVVEGLPYTATLGSPATVSIAWDDADGDQLIDGTSPGLPVAGIRMYTLNTTVNRWEELPTTLDLARRRAVGVTPHFSVFALFAPSTLGSALTQVRVYPVPWKPGSGGKFDAPGVTFDRLPAEGSISILNLAGENVADLRFSGSNGGFVVWDGRNNAGRRAASGVYYARVRSDPDDSTALLRFAIER